MNKDRDGKCYSNWQQQIYELLEYAIIHVKKCNIKTYRFWLTKTLPSPVNCLCTNLTKTENLNAKITR